MKILTAICLVVLSFAVVSCVIFQDGESRYYANVTDFYNVITSFNYDLRHLKELGSEMEDLSYNFDILLNQFPQFLQPPDMSDTDGIDSIIEILSYVLRVIIGFFEFFASFIILSANLILYSLRFAFYLLVDAAEFLVQFLRAFFTLLGDPEYWLTYNS